MSEYPIKTCDHCGATGEMPTFMNGETTCYECLKKGDRRKWKREDVEAYCRDKGLVIGPKDPDVDIVSAGMDAFPDDASVVTGKHVIKVYKAMVAAFRVQAL